MRNSWFWRGTFILAFHLRVFNDVTFGVGLQPLPDACFQSQAGRKTQGGADIDANMKMGPDEEDLMDDQWREWDWDAEEETF